MLPNTIHTDNEAPEDMRKKILDGLMKLPEEIRRELLEPYFEKYGSSIKNTGHMGKNQKSELLVHPGNTQDCLG